MMGEETSLLMGFPFILLFLSDENPPKMFDDNPIVSIALPSSHTYVQYKNKQKKRG